MKFIRVLQASADEHCEAGGAQTSARDSKRHTGAGLTRAAWWNLIILVVFHIYCLYELLAVRAFVGMRK